MSLATTEIAPITLEELNAAAALMTRVDRKYLVRLEKLDELLADLPRGTRRLTIEGRHSFAYLSAYFDTPSLDSYLQAARRRPRRIKIRTRTYLDSGLQMLEVKSRAGAWTNKRRVPTLSQVELDQAGAELVDVTAQEMGLDGLSSAELSPQLTCEYNRTTFHIAADQTRLTIDTDLVWSAETKTVELGQWVVIETKGGRQPGVIDRLLWRHGIRPTKTSKYCTGMAALHPELPHNHWHRTLLRIAA